MAKLFFRGNVRLSPAFRALLIEEPKYEDKIRNRIGNRRNSRDGMGRYVQR
jgi:hypothetical protein